MLKIKYLPLKNNKDDPEEQNYYPKQSTRFQNCVKEYKKQCLLKMLLICFVVVNVIYVINSFQGHNETDLTFNGTARFILNTTVQSEHGSGSSQTPIDLSSTVFEKEKEDRNDRNKSFINKTVKANSENFTNVIEEYGFGENANHNASFKITTTTIKSRVFIDNNNSIRPTKTYLNENNSNKTKLEDPPLKIYPSKQILQNTKTIDDLETTTTTIASTATTTTTINPTIIANEEKYELNTSHCHILFVEPFTPEIRKIFKPQHYTGCTKDQPIVTVSFNEHETKYILHINYTVAKSLKKSTKNIKVIEHDILCCYREILRNGSGSNVDDSFKLLPCINFHQNFVVPTHINGIIVNCKSKSQKSILQEDAFSFVQINRTLIEQRTKNYKKAATDKRKISILLIGVDTLSRINFRRNMPEMLKYLGDNNWFELLGYNKVGDNTLPNLMPLLAGYTEETVYEKCKPDEIGGFDNCNFIWNNYKENGYHTVYAEDSSTITTFNYHLQGFKKAPTDYYFRPMSLAIEKSMKKKSKAGLNYCIGRKQYGEYVYDYATEFLKRYKYLPSFGLFWTNSFSHNSYDISATMDKTLVNYFQQWQKQGVFENSLVIFFSDHGLRWGPLLKLSQGFFEERLPMFFISLPKWFREAHPQLVNNLEINQKRLITPFDIHMTLQHLLELSEPSYKVQQALDCPKCQSIFKEMPENRTCDDASIPQAWCACVPFATLSPQNPVVQTVAKLIVQEMNNYLENKNLTSLCSPFQLNEITNAKRFFPDKAKSSTTTYGVTFVTNPIIEPKALFSAILDYSAKEKRIQLNVEDIGRQSFYGKTSKCIEDKHSKKYCICKDYLIEEREKNMIESNETNSTKKMPYKKRDRCL